MSRHCELVTPARHGTFRDRLTPCPVAATTSVTYRHAFGVAASVACAPDMAVPPAEKDNSPVTHTSSDCAVVAGRRRFPESNQPRALSRQQEKPRACRSYRRVFCRRRSDAGVVCTREVRSSDRHTKGEAVMHLQRITVTFVGGNADRRELALTPGSNGTMPREQRFLGSRYIFESDNNLYRHCPATRPTDENRFGPPSSGVTRFRRLATRYAGPPSEPGAGH